MRVTSSASTAVAQIVSKHKHNGADQETYLERVLQSIGFTSFFNITGCPAMSVPLHWRDDGVPQGTQFAAAYGNEALLFRLAAQLEHAYPWSQRRPELGLV